MKAAYIFPILIILLSGIIYGSFLDLFMGDTEDKAVEELQIISSGKQWNILYSTDTDFFYLIADKTRQKTEICLASKQAVKLGDVSESKNVYNKEGQLLTQLSRETIQLEKDYYGYCRTVGTEDYLKFGEDSTIIEYQDINLLSYDTNFASVNITLYKNISGTWSNTVNEIFVFHNTNSEKFGANDSSNPGLERYKYIIESTSPIIENNLKPYIKDPIKKIGQLADWYEGHVLDFSDICNRNFSTDCQFKLYNYSHYFLEVEFTSDMFIDPIISITDIDTEIISTNIICQGTDLFCHLNFTDYQLQIYVPGDFGDLGAGYWELVNNYAGIEQNATYNATSGFNGGGAYDFNGLNQFIGLGSLPHQDLVTMTAWVKPALSQHTTGRIVMSNDDGANQMDWQVFIPSNQRYYRFRVDTAGGFTTLDTPAFNTANTWYHIASTYDGSDMTIYVNGVLNVSKAHPNPGFIQDDNAAFIIGATANAAVRYFWSGTIDEVMVFNRSLNSSEIFQIYNSSFQRFFSTGNHTLNQTIASGYNRVNATIHESNQNNTNLSLRINDGISWTASQNMTDGVISTFIIDNTASMLNISFKYHSSSNQFWSPILETNITLETFNAIDVGDSCSPAEGADHTYVCSDNCVVSSPTILRNVDFTETGGLWLYADLYVKNITYKAGCDIYRTNGNDLYGIT